MSNNSGSTLARIFALVALAFVIGAGVLYANHASAGSATFVVTKEADTNDGSCDPSDCSVREAFVAANAASISGVASRPVIQIPAGMYKIMIAGAGENLSATGDFDITRDVTVIGAGPASTFLDGNDLDRLIDVRAGVSLNISGLTIQHGKVGPGSVGGLRAEGSLVMSNVHVVNNKGDGTDDDGVTAGVYVWNHGEITDSVISTNVATGNSTGGLVGRSTSDLIIRNTIIQGNTTTGKSPIGGVGLYGRAFLDNVTVKDNRAIGHDATGGMFAGKLSAVTIRNSQFLNNDTTSDLSVGGLFNRGQMTVWDTTVDGNDTGTEGVGGVLSLNNDDNTSKITLRRVTISNNTALSNNAIGGVAIDAPADFAEVTIDHNSAHNSATGGLKFFGADPVQMERVKITNNAAGTDATAGLNVLGSSHVTVTDSWIDHNTAVDKAVGGVHVGSNAVANLNRVAVTNNSLTGAGTGGVDVFQATANLQNVTISGNSAVGNATGGAYVESGTLNLHFVTIDNNSASGIQGVGGLTSYGTLTITNSIVGANAGQDNCFQTAGASTGHNLDIGNTCGFNQPTDKHDMDPLLGTLGITGDAFSPTEPLAPNSPAVNAAGACTLTEDQRISPRPVGGACDIGAFELGSVATTTREWGDLLCANGAGPEDALVLIAQGSGVAAPASPAGAACPGIGDDTYIAGWFLHNSWGDVNCSGLVDILDALAILQGVVNIDYPSAAACPKVGDEVQVG